MPSFRGEVSALPLCNVLVYATFCVGVVVTYLNHELLNICIQLGEESTPPNQIRIGKW